MQKFICTNCSYTYYPFLGEEEAEIEPGTDFNDIDESWTCPNCGEGKETFMGINETIQEVYSLSSMTNEEEQHIPFYHERGGQLFVTVGKEGNYHPEEEDHGVEYVWIFDEEGEVLEMIQKPKTEDGEPLIFDVEGLSDYEVRAACNIHGVWKGMELH